MMITGGPNRFFVTVTLDRIPVVNRCACDVRAREQAGWAGRAAAMQFLGVQGRRLRRAVAARWVVTIEDK